MVERLCEQKHMAINQALDRHSKWLGEHEEKLDCLTKSDATNTNEIKNLCQRIGSQTTAIWGLVASVFMVLLGFLIWYIQSLPRG